MFFRVIRNKILERISRERLHVKFHLWLRLVSGVYAAVPSIAASDLWEEKWVLAESAELQKRFSQ